MFDLASVYAFGVKRDTIWAKSVLIGVNRGFFEMNTDDLPVIWGAPTFVKRGELRLWEAVGVQLDTFELERDADVAKWTGAVAGKSCVGLKLSLFDL